jgi:O-antigen/teichoic acid export membrane protein
MIQSVNTLAVLRFIRFWRKNEVDSPESFYLEYDHRRFGLLQILNLFVSQIDVILINAFLGSNDVAFYSTFLKIFQIPYLIYSSVLSIYTNSFSTLISTNEKSRISNLLLSIYRYASLVVIPSLIFLIFSEGFLVAFLSNGLFEFSNIQVFVGLSMVIVSFLDYPLALLRSSIVPSRSYFVIVILASLTNLLASVMLMIVWKNPVAIIIPNILTIALINIPANLVLLRFLIGRQS